MRIAIIGAGNVGGTLAKKWAAKGHKIHVGARDLAKPEIKALAAEIGAQATVESPKQAAQNAEVVCLATPWFNTETAIQALGDLSGKVLIDCTNPLKKDLSGLTHGLETSGAEQVADWAKGAQVVKSFNTVGFNIMADPLLDGRKTVMFYCGDHAGAKEIVRSLIADVGFEPVDAGPLSSSRLLEPFALLWISAAYKFGLGREFAFSLLRRT